MSLSPLAPLLAGLSLALLTGCSGDRANPSDRMARLRGEGPNAVFRPGPAVNPPAATPAVPGGDAEGLAALRAGAAANPLDAAAQMRHALAAEDAGELAEAIAALDRLVTIAGASVPVLLAKGRLELATRALLEAADSFRRVLQSAPDNLEALAGLGVSYDMLGDHARAQIHYREGLAQQPGDFRLLANLGLSLVMSGRNRDAVQLLARVETDVAAPRRARHNYAMALLADNQRMRAVRLLRLDMGGVEAEQLANEFAASIAAMPGQRAVNALRLPDPTESQLRRLLPSPAAPELPSSPPAAVPEPPTATPPAGVTREELPPVVAPAAAPAAAPPMADRSRRKA